MLASNSLCSQGWPETSDPPTSIFWNMTAVYPCAWLYKVLGIKLRTSWMLSKHSFSWAMSPALSSLSESPQVRLDFASRWAFSWGLTHREEHSGQFRRGDYLRQERIPGKGPLEVVTSGEQHIKSVNKRHFRNTFQRPWIIPSASEPLEKNVHCSPFLLFLHFCLEYNGYFSLIRHWWVWR